MCRYCHDENETHFFNRKTVTELICTECDTRQRVQAECEKCGVRFGRVSIVAWVALFLLGWVFWNLSVEVSVKVKIKALVWG